MKRFKELQKCPRCGNTPNGIHAGGGKVVASCACGYSVELDARLLQPGQFTTAVQVAWDMVAEAEQRGAERERAKAQKLAEALRKLVPPECGDGCGILSDCDLCSNAQSALAEWEAKR